MPQAAMAVLAGALLLSACDGAPAGGQTVDRPAEHVVGIATSLPILWPESPTVSGLLDNERPAHWALGILRESGGVRPLDNLASPSGKLPLPADAWLVLAQPYPLSPQENVALDDWVRSGGRVLLFADPMLTHESLYALGDRRRPQDVALLSPILARWGLVLQFDEAQARGEREVPLGDEMIAVNLPGSFVRIAGTGKCGLEAQDLLAICTIERGRVVAIADAALLEAAQGEALSARQSALRALLARLAN